MSQHEEMRASYNFGSADIVDRFYKSRRDIGSAGGNTLSDTNYSGKCYNSLPLALIMSGANLPDPRSYSELLRQVQSSLS